MKIGILGGGQLGRMLLQAGTNYTAETFVLENDENCPSAHLCNCFVKGDINDFETVYHFGKQLDALTIEIESVNVEALEKLEFEGVRVYPSPKALRIIKSKITQKEFFKTNNIPTADFKITQTKSELKQLEYFLPAVHKISEGGYDGKGVEIIKDISQIDKAFDTPSILEKMVKVQKEIALIVAINDKGETVIYPPAEMVFDIRYNLLDYQVSPARIEKSILWKAEAIALKTIKELKSAGIFAVEMFIDDKNDILVNEIAPRVHNSGHHTIEANFCSQFDMLWRILLQYPLGNPKEILPSAMINLVGNEGYTGNAKYIGLDEILKLDNAYIHLYGKIQTKPGRKMGHITVIASDYNELTYQAHKIKNLIKVES